jgi:outer membrane protein TolC
MKKLLFIGFIFSVLNSNAQDTLLLSIEKLNTLMLNQNITIKQNTAVFNLTESEHKIQIGKALPTFSFGARQYTLDGFTQSTEGNFVDVNKNNEFRGISLSAKWDMSNLLYNTLSANKKIEAAFFRKSSEDIDEKIEITNLFYDLSASQNSEKVLEQILNKNTEILDQMTLQYSAGLILESELLLSKANLNNLKIQLLNQKKVTYQSNQKLISILNIDEDYIIKTDFDFYTTAQLSIDNKIIDELAEYRFEYQHSNLLYISEELQLKKQKFGFVLPNLSLGLNDGMFGGIGLDPMGNQNIFSASLMWNIPLSRFFQAGELEKQNQILQIHSFKQESLKNELILEMRTLLSELNLSNEQLQYAKQSVDFTKKSYEQSLQRQKLGTSNQLELFHAEKEYINAQLVYIELLSVMHKLKLKEKFILNDKVLKY